MPRLKLNFPLVSSVFEDNKVCLYNSDSKIDKKSVKIILRCSSLFFYILHLTRQLEKGVNDLADRWDNMENIVALKR